MEGDTDDIYDTSLLTRRTKPISSQAMSSVMSSSMMSSRPSRLALNMSSNNSFRPLSQQSRGNSTIIPCSTKRAGSKMSGSLSFVSKPIVNRPTIDKEAPSRDIDHRSNAVKRNLPASSQAKKSKPESNVKQKQPLSQQSSHSDSKLKIEQSNRFCPTCGLPARMLMLEFDLHILSCKKVGTQSKECVIKEQCMSTDPKHFREYYHPRDKQLLSQTIFSPIASPTRKSSVTLPPATVASVANKSVLPEPAPKHTVASPPCMLPPAAVVSITNKSTLPAPRNTETAKISSLANKRKSPNSCASTNEPVVNSAKDKHGSSPAPVDKRSRRTGGPPRSSLNPVLQQHGVAKRKDPSRTKSDSTSTFRRSESSSKPTEKTQAPSPVSSDKENNPNRSEKKLANVHVPPLALYLDMEDSPSMLEDYQAPPTIGQLISEQGDSRSLLDIYLDPCPPIKPPSYTRNLNTPSIFNELGPLSTSLNSTDTDSPSYELLSVKDGGAEVQGPGHQDKPLSASKSVATDDTASITFPLNDLETVNFNVDDTCSIIFENCETVVLLSSDDDDGPSVALKKLNDDTVASVQGKLATAVTNNIDNPNILLPNQVSSYESTLPFTNDSPSILEVPSLVVEPHSFLDSDSICSKTTVGVHVDTHEELLNSEENMNSIYSKSTVGVHVDTHDEELSNSEEYMNSIYSKSTVGGHVDKHDEELLNSEEISNSQEVLFVQETSSSERSTIGEVLNSQEVRTLRGVSNVEELSTETEAVPCGDHLNCSAVITYADAGSVTPSPVRSSVVLCSCDRAPPPHGDVTASVSVHVRASEGDGPPVRINATCGPDGWDAIGVEANADVNVGAYSVDVSECQRRMTFGCRVERRREGGSERRGMENKFHATLEGLGIAASPNGKRKRQVQLSTTSFLGTGGDKTGAFKVVRQVMKEAEGKARSGSLLPNVSTQVVDVERTSRQERAAQCKSAWQKLMQPPHKSVNVVSGNESSSSSSYSASSTATRTCPFYRKIAGTSFAVDAFNFGKIPGISAYFLSHFHYDHYIGLRKTFDMPIYCSSITASLIRLKIGVHSKHLHVVPLHQKTIINGVTVTALDANHCPGSVMFLFQLSNGRNQLHVGDFRATPEMESYPEFWSLSVDRLFLDTTYCDPKYCFPSQDESIESVVEYTQKHVANHAKTLIVCGSYTIGKEKVFERIANVLNCKIYAASDKRRILDLLENVNISSRLVDRPLDARVHVVNMQQLRHDLLNKELTKYKAAFTNVLAFKPTGWEFKDSRTLSPVTRGQVTVVGVPYSEHSSFTELRRFVQFIRPNLVVPTVNVGKPAQRDAMQRHFNTWLSSASRSHGAVPSNT